MEYITNNFGTESKLIVFVQQQLKYAYNILNVFMNILIARQQKGENEKNDLFANTSHILVLST